MRTCLYLLIPLLALGSSEHVRTQKKSSCTDPGVRVTMLNNAVDPISGTDTPSALLSDGGGEYANGSASATIHVCDGTNNMVLNLSSTKRTFVFQFPDAAPGSVIQSKPTWVPGTYSVSGWIDVRNLLFSAQPFTTHMGTTFTGPDRSSYRIGFMPVVVDAPDLHQVNGDENIPHSSSPAKVFPQAFDCTSGGTTKPSWLVIGNNPSADTGLVQVGTLYKLANSPRGSDTHEGQYVLPFEFRIDALSCFSY